MKFKIGDHLQDIDSTDHGIVMEIAELEKSSNDRNWYLIENYELGLVNHWMPEYKLELHKQTLRELKLNELGI